MPVTQWPSLALSAWQWEPLHEIHPAEKLISAHSTLLMRKKLLIQCTLHDVQLMNQQCLRVGHKYAWPMEVTVCGMLHSLAERAADACDLQSAQPLSPSTACQGW